MGYRDTKESLLDYHRKWRAQNPDKVNKAIPQRTQYRAVEFVTVLKVTY